MLYETLSQPQIFLLIILFGFLTGFIFDLLNLLKNVIKIKFFNNFILFLGVFLSIFIFYLINLNLNYGEFRFYVLFSFALAFTIERILLGNLVAQSLKKCYNNIKLKGKNKFKNESKFTKRNKRRKKQ